MPGFLSPGKGASLHLIPEYSGINKGQRVPDRSKTAHRKPLVKCFLTATQERWIMVDSSDNTWPTGEGNGKPLQYSCLENPINSMTIHHKRNLFLFIFQDSQGACNSSLISASSCILSTPLPSPSISAWVLETQSRIRSIWHFIYKADKHWQLFPGNSVQDCTVWFFFEVVGFSFDGILLNILFYLINIGLDSWHKFQCSLNKKNFQMTDLNYPF